MLRNAIAGILLVFAGAFGYIAWLARHYKSIAMDRIPRLIAQASDSVYQISFTGIDVSLFRHTLSVTGVRLWPDTVKAQRLRKQGIVVPRTFSTVYIRQLDGTGVEWENIIGNRSVDVESAVVHGLKWEMDHKGRTDDSTIQEEVQKKHFLDKITCKRLMLVSPLVTYYYHGENERFRYAIKGGNIVLYDWVYNYNSKVDTSLLLFAHAGMLRPDSFTLVNKNGHFVASEPALDFSADSTSVILKNIRLNKMVVTDLHNGSVKQITTCHFPSARLNGFNWNRLIRNNNLAMKELDLRQPYIHVRSYDKNADYSKNRKGGHPHQMLLRVGIRTNIRKVRISNGTYRYTEVTLKDVEVPIDFYDINGTFSNVTNMKEVRAGNSTCTIKLEGKYMNKSPVSANFALSLADRSGRFTVDATLRDLDGDDISQQASAFTLAKVTSFHLTEMKMHITGNQDYSEGSFTALYDNLKISLLKFDTKLRDHSRGPLDLLGSVILFYPSNPMPGKGVRSVTTTFARDSTRGFVNQLWTHIYRAAKKTAVRNQDIVEVTDGKETAPGEKPKKGFFRRLFGKKNKP